ncbi:MAG: acyltransferase [Dehalococcoidales bacterium]|jgi:galactoside O-acetyltransferase
MNSRALTPLFGELSAWFEAVFVKNMPGDIGASVRRRYWSKMTNGAPNFNISIGCVITNPKSISIGEGTNILHNCCLYAHGGGMIKIGSRAAINSNVMLGAADKGTITIGDDVLIGPNVVIRASNHRYEKKDIPVNRQGHAGGKIAIEDDVWIGANCTILPDVTIGRGAIIGAGAVVTRDVPPFSLAGGVPAAVIKGNCRS